ncbi:alpha/beta fold hydrolase [Nocardia asiatica]|uniref:alpha/beta fold hydrolase n=1 Tax=Nocardia asiatica TaxID=209252 RepID=UPI0002EA666F|nr:alpha/beta hydrolase [Nocardia asiatica]
MSNGTPTASRQRSVVSADGTSIGYRSMGSGPGVIVVGGALCTAQDYLPLAAELARSCTVHLVERRGRGASGPLGRDYSLRKEVDDLLAVHTDTSARLAFGHSYGGLAILETVRSSPVFDRIALYEPGAPGGQIATEWMAPYRARLAAYDPYGAFAHFVQGSGGAPRFVAKLPHWYLRGALRIGFRGQRWQRMRPLLEANLAEHEQLAAQRDRLDEFADLTAATLILSGTRTSSATRAELDALTDTLPNADSDTMKGLDHFGPEGKSGQAVAARVVPFLLEH